MTALFATILLFAADSGSGGFTKFYNEWLNIPGFEAWKFINLGLFIAILIYILKKQGISETFKAKRDEIRAELIKAEEEKQAALARLTEAEGKIAQLETEKENILTRAKEEGAAEKKRLADQTKADIERLRQQVEADLARLTGQTRAELRRFSAEESIRLAEAKLRSEIDGKTDARLVKTSISEMIGGLNR
jgi:F0F1-type ATP synthase membrane subunit b/b'